MAVSNYWLNPSLSVLAARGRTSISLAPPVTPTGSDWSDTNLPWKYTSTAEFTARWPAGVVYRDLQTAAGDFFTNLQNTVNAAGQRVVVRCQNNQKHVHSLTSFRLIGSSGDQAYSFGFWFPNFRGWLGQGADICHIQMDANSMSSAQLTRLRGMQMADFAPNQMGLCRIDGSAASPVLLGGVTFRAADQNMISGFTASDMQSLFTPQPAPHNGVVLFQNAPAVISHCRFQGAGRAMNSRPPFEHANIGSQYGDVRYYNCEFDGRRAADLDPARPRRCGVVMANNESYHLIQDSWLHHSNISRYAANDENRDTQGQYILTRVKAEQITNNQNRDPALNSGNTLGGYTNATPLGWESCNGTITLNDCIISQDNPVGDSLGIPQHIQLTSVGGRNPQGGRLVVNGGTFKNTGWPQLDGFVCFRIQQNTYWATDGYNTTLSVFHKAGQRLAPYYHPGSWPPTAAQLAASGITPTTHYIVRQA